MLVRHGGVTLETSALLADASAWLDGGVASPELLAITATVNDMDRSTPECGARAAVIAASGSAMFGHVGWWAHITLRVARDLGMLCESYPWESACRGRRVMR